MLRSLQELLANRLVPGSHAVKHLYMARNSPSQNEEGGKPPWVHRAARSPASVPGQRQAVTAHSLSPSLAAHGSNSEARGDQLPPAGLHRQDHRGHHGDESLHPGSEVRAAKSRRLCARRWVWIWCSERIKRGTRNVFALDEGTRKHRVRLVGELASGPGKKKIGSNALLSDSVILKPFFWF